ncbi:hypothetical protein SAMN05421493_105138 [Pseudobutyrivibrio sp. 49]|uniref:DUF3990 domain-containing protein n=1 Tax=Pseudobutyrivibrio sp. 49 TaxID=1855344 RepID=UPI000880761D|nr:DUF3990 domain-containing protein [Pseudobutyrivibrio sp. 49]SDH91866.1 hypothetical protein SAMN05421493_105138 [Pseudobutyrivibrio sp. 49]
MDAGIFNIYEYTLSDDLKIKVFDEMTEEWLEAFWALAKFKHPTHQISFHSAKALASLKYIESIEGKN